MLRSSRGVYCYYKREENKAIDRGAQRVTEPEGAGSHWRWGSERGQEGVSKGQLTAEGFHFHMMLGRVGRESSFCPASQSGSSSS